MAKKKYKVKAGDSFATFPNPQEVMSLNPGVANLSPGQTIWTPSSPNPNNVFGPLVTNQGFSPPAATPTNFTSANSFQSGNFFNTGSVNVGAPQINPAFANQPEFMSPGGMNTPAPAAAPAGGANSFQSGSQINNQAALQTIVNGSVAQPQSNNNTPAPTSVTLPPNYVYTGGNDPLAVEQRRQWNIAAGGTGDERVFLMTREQKKAIGDAKRRKRGNRAQMELAAAQNIEAVVQDTPAPQGNAVNAALSWRVG